jgi:hypothetical protein
MSKRDLPPDLRATMKLFAEAQIERLEAMSPEELDDTLRAQGLDPNEPIDLVGMLPPEPAAPVVPLRPKRAASRVPVLAWIALPAAAAALVAFPLPKPDERITRAGELRDDAAKECDQKRWKECARALDEAGDLDPAGESEERVERLRVAIALSEPPPEKKPETPVPRRLPPHYDVKPPLPPRRP